MDQRPNQEPSRAEAAFADFLRRRREGEEVDFEGLVREHPGLAVGLRLLNSVQGGPPDLSDSAALARGLRETLGEPVEPLGPGKSLGDYRLRRELGRGGMGIVFEAEQASLGRRVALKVLPLQAILDRTHLERFRREAEAAARLHHPNIVPVHGVGQAGGIHYFAMQFIHGRGLDRVIAELRELPSPSGDLGALGAEQDDRTGAPDSGTSRRAFYRSVARIGVQVAGALSYAHGEGILHRDIKPSNLILDPQGTVWVTDFGLAKVEGGESLTQTGDVLGTLRYMPPEQSRGWSDPRSDVYSLGVTLYEILTLRRAFDAADRSGLLEQLAVCEPPRPRKLDRRVPRDLETIILKAIRKEPAQRYQTASQLADDLRRFLAGEPIRARSIGAWGRAVKWARRRPALAALVGVSSLAALALLAGGFRFAMERARVRAEHRAGRATLYASQMHLAHQAWEEGKTRMVLDVLGSQACLPSKEEPSDPRGWEWNYLRGLCHKDLLSLSVGADLLLTSVAWSPDGRWIAASSYDTPKIFLWDLKSGCTHRALEGHAYRVNTVIFSSDSRWLVSGGEDGYVSFWDPVTGKRLYSCSGPWWVHGIAVSPDGRIVAAGKHDIVWVWDVATQAVLAKLQGHGPILKAVAFSPDGRILASTGQDGAVKLWNTGTWKEIYTATGHRAPILAVTFSPDGKLIATASEDLTARIMDVRTGRLVHVLRGHGSWVGGVSFSPDGGWIATSSGDQTLKLWDSTSGEEIRTLRGNTEPQVSFAFSPDGRLIATAGYRGAVKIWDLEPGPQEAGALEAHQIFVSVAFSPDGRWLAAGTRSPQVRLWKLGEGGGERILTDLAAETWAVAFNWDSTRLASGSDDGIVKLWDVASGRALSSFKAHQGLVRGVAFSPDGTRLVTGGFDKTAKVWELSTSREVHRLSCADTPAVSWRGDGLLIATGSQDKKVRLWDPGSGMLLRELEGHSSNVNAVAFHSGGHWLASAADDSTVRLWDVSDGREIRVFHGHTSDVWGLAFSPDGRRLASGSLDRQVKLWDVESGHETLTLRGHKLFVYSVAFSPDGRMLASGGHEAVRLWNAPYEPSEERPAAQLPSEEEMRAWHVRQAPEREAAGRWFAAAFHLDRLLAAEPGRGDLRVRRGRARAELGDWDLAASDLYATVECGAPSEAVAALGKTLSEERRCSNQLDGKGVIRIGVTSTSFVEAGPPPGYHVPLPQGLYRVTLHFAEAADHDRRPRSFDVFLEGDRVLTIQAPPPGGAGTERTQAVFTHVDDGFLDLRLVGLASDPALPELEVERG